VDTLTEVPADRWDVDLFDVRLFGIAPYQIGQINPQQRLILKIALGNSGITPEKLSGRHYGINHRLRWSGAAFWVK
jgi:acyl transferase domain-containing protein